jgi:hypothetical protein
LEELKNPIHGFLCCFVFAQKICWSWSRDEFMFLDEPSATFFVDPKDGGAKDSDAAGVADTFCDGVSSQPSSFIGQIWPSDNQPLIPDLGQEPFWQAHRCAQGFDRATASAAFRHRTSD